MIQKCHALAACPGGDCAHEASGTGTDYDDIE
jgi:hypothetical protein